jgi:hypothetical protein
MYSKQGGKDKKSKRTGNGSVIIRNASLSLSPAADKELLKLL